LGFCVTLTPAIMSRLIFALLVLASVLLQVSYVVSQEPEEEPSSPENSATSESKPSADSPSDYSKESSVVEKFELRWRFENDGTGRREQTGRVRVKSDAGVQRWGRLRFGYNSANETIEITYVRVLKPDGSVVTAGADAVQEVTGQIQRVAPVYTDFREKHITVPGLRAGDTLEWQSVTVIHTPLAPGQFWTQYNFQKAQVVLEEKLEIDVPAARPIKLETKPGYDPKISEDNGRRVYRWSTANLETQASKAAADKNNDKDKKKKKKPQELTADVQLSSFASWEEVGRWYAGLEKDRRVPSKAVKAKADELTKGKQSDLAKIEALYDYTALNFRYVSLALGIGRYQPHSADEVLHNQYGDCKDKNTLLAALLEAEGYHSSTVLISSVYKLDPDVPSPAQFNHAITMVPLPKEEVWMDTTTEVAPFRLLLYSLRKKQALVIPQDGTPQLEETPADSPMPDTQVLQIEGNVDDTGKLDARIAYEIRGDSEVPIRRAFRNVASAQWLQIAEGMSSIEGMGKDVSEVKVSDLSATNEPLKFSYRVVKANYVDPSKKKVGIKLPLAVLGLAAANAEDADGPDPIKLGPPTSRVYKVRLDFPAKYTLRLPVPFSVKRDYGNYEVTYKIESNVLTSERRLTTNQAELPSARVQDYLAFRRSVVEDLAQQISLETESTSTGVTPSADAKPSELFKRGNDARKEGNYSLAIDLLKRGTDADPKTNNGWNELGLAYFDSRQDDLALTALQKQIEVTPYHPNAFDNIGRIYLRRRKYDDAMKWFNKQIEVDPLNKNAHYNIGTALLEERKYTDALPTLEKSASLSPDNAEAQVHLGEAYLNLGQDDKAVAAFDQALKLSTRPVTWNNIAYRLALKKSHLDLARSYSESAVSTTVASLRVVSLDSLDARDLGKTSSLATCWDTLGWVAFAENKPDQAQKYLISAWQLSRSSVVADHAAQVFESQGDKERAIHFYALAMNAHRPDPETRRRLVALVGSDDKAEAAIAKSRDEFTALSTIKIPNAAKVEGKADFFVLLKTGSVPEAVVESVKFVSGEEKLKPLAAALSSNHFDQSLPDSTPVKILRRGTLSCAANAPDCAFQMAPPDEVRSVN
jgi:tetratricopeptide (TPR) repeat protein